MLYRCEDRAHGQPYMIYGSKDTDTAWKEELELKGKNLPAGGSVTGARADETMEVKGRSNCQILQSLFFPMTNHAIGQIHFLATRTVHQMHTHKPFLFLRIWDLNLANRIENWSKEQN